MASPLSLDRLRAVVQDSFGKHLFENAIFFADKLVTLSGGNADDVYRLVQAFVFTKQYRRALHVLNKTNQATSSSRFRYLTAKCLSECQELGRVPDGRSMMPRCAPSKRRRPARAARTGR